MDVYLESLNNFFNYISAPLTLPFIRGATCPQINRYTQFPFELVGVQRLQTNVSLTSVRWSTKMLTRDKRTSTEKR